MDLNTKNSSGMMNGLPPTNKEDRKVGPILGALVVVTIIIGVMLFFFGQRLNVQNSKITPTQTQNTTAVTQPVTVSTTSEIESINKDLDNQLKDIDYSF